MNFIVFIPLLCVLSTVNCASCPSPVSWKKHEAQLTSIATELTGYLNSDVVKSIIAKYDPLKLQGELLNKFKFSGETKKVWYDFRYDLSVSDLHLEGFSGVTVVPVSVLSDRSLQFRLKLQRMRIKSAAKVVVHQLTQSGCTDREEGWGGLCYRKCRILSGGSHPLRTATNTCAKDGCAPDEEKDAGLCYPRCKPKYKGVGPVCWGRCNEFYGDEYKDTGLTCHRWWPPHSRSKPSYGRGVGKLPHAPWTKGLGCNGFGVSDDGGCAYPYWRICYLENLALKKPGQCSPRTIHGKADFSFEQPELTTDFILEAPECPASSGGGITCMAQALAAVVVGAIDPSQADKVLDNFRGLLKLVKKFEVLKVQLGYKSADMKLDLKHDGRYLTGLALDFATNGIKKRLADADTVKKMVNDELLNGIVKTKANAAVKAELRESGANCD